MNTQKICGKFLRDMILTTCLAVSIVAMNAPIYAEEGVEAQSEEEYFTKEYSFSEIVAESVAGDVYSDAAAANWQDLSYGDFFSKGWDKPWVSPPNGGGGAPRQGWLNAYEGVFYRLGIAVFGWQHDLAKNGDGYSGNLVNFTPINQRFQLQTDFSLQSNRGVAGNDPQTNFGDLQITPRFMLSV